MATAVAQLYMAVPHSPSMWKLQHTGVLCFVKDNPQRSFFIRMFDMKAGKLVWEQELYNQIVYNSPQPFFHTFPADECQVGLNFPVEEEADAFQDAVLEKINQRNNRPDKKQRHLLHSDRGSLPPVPGGKAPASTSSLQMATMDIQNPDIQGSRYRSMPLPAAPAALSGKQKKDKKSKKKGPKFSKADIGAPSGFKHVTHVGWDPNNMDPDVMKLLSQAGIAEGDMKDEATSQLIYDVIEQSGGIEALRKEVNSRAGPPPPPPGRHGPVPPVPNPLHAAPAPPPSRRSGPLPPVPGQTVRGSPSQTPQARGAMPPLPPPNRSGPPPPPPPSAPGHSSPSHFPPPPPSNFSHPPHLPPTPSQQYSMGVPPPPVPSTPSRGGSAPAPPPPPPPPPPQISSGFPPPPPLCGNKPPLQKTSSDGGGESRGALLDQIRIGKKLKNVTESSDPPPSASPAAGEGIVGALMMVMQKRSKAIHSSDESEDEGGDDEDDEDWDD
ncbi:WASP actin nucleation promoting factor b isoform X2 [Genypterus blacodes]